MVALRVHNGPDLTKHSTQNQIHVNSLMEPNAGDVPCGIWVGRKGPGGIQDPQFGARVQSVPDAANA